MTSNAVPTAAFRSKKIRVLMMDFLRTGLFGPLALGASRDAVFTALGEPDEIPGPVLRHRKPAVWKYGQLEFHFTPRTDELVRIHVQCFEPSWAGSRIELDPWWMSNTATLAQAQLEFADVGMSFEAIEPPNDSSLRYRAGAGVVLDFQRQSLQRFLGLSFSL